jgi:hypothetical protein
MSDEENEVRDETADTREPYEPPKLEVEDLFESLALACGKVVPVSFSCRGHPRIS